MRISEKRHNNNNSDNTLTSPRTDGGKNTCLENAANFSRQQVLTKNHPWVVVSFLQNVSQRQGHNRSNTAPSISITPLPGRAGGGGITNSNQRRSMGGQGSSGQGAGMKPGAPASGAKGSFVICEICDGYIKDLEQLRNHMMWIHKVREQVSRMSCMFTIRKSNFRLVCSFI